MMSLRFSFAVAALTAGCLAPVDDVELATQAATGGEDEWGCPVWGCGSNSPVVDTFGFHELNERGAPNEQGLRITGFRRGSTGLSMYRVDVVDGELFARPTDGAAQTLSGEDLIGMQLRVVDDDHLRAYRIRVAAVGTTWLWAKPGGSRRPTPTYKLEWIVDDAASPGGWKNLCSNPDANEPGMSSRHVVLFDDDRIDAVTKAVTGQTADWFNIGCAGHALAKQYLTGHTKASSARLGVTTTLAQRTANLKMLAADYCGNGHAFTVAGERLAWRDQFGWYDSIASTPAAIEARWTENGAACLNTPRLDWNQTATQFGDSVEDESVATCTRPPPCTSTDPHEMQGSLIVSAFNE